MPGVNFGVGIQAGEIAVAHVIRENVDDVRFFVNVRKYLFEPGLSKIESSCKIRPSFNWG